MRKILLGLVATAAVAGSVVSVATAAGATPADPAPGSGAATPNWGPCQPTPGANIDPRQQCATIGVPMDYRNPTGPQISIAISRITTATPGSRRGVLVLAPAGAGPGLNNPSQAVHQLPADVQARYDLVGYDARGTGQSTRLSCGIQDADALMPLPWPGADGDITANVDRAKRVADACAANGGPLLRQITARNQARDLDRIRAALGEAKVSYLSNTYGTYVGAVYATMFPNRTDRVVLDSNLDPRVAEHGLATNIGQGVADRFPDFAAWAAARNDTYGLGTTQDAVRDLFLRQAATLEHTPRPDLNVKVYHATMFAALPSDRTFPLLAQLMQAVQTGGQLPPIPFPQTGPELENNVSVLTATACNDVSWPRSVADYARAVTVSRAVFPLTAGMPANVWPCAFWPNQPVEAPTRVTPNGPSNVLMIQNLRDPVTPYSAALAMRTAFGQRARLVTVDAGGHDSYLANGNACGDAAVTAFLTDGTRTAHDIRCQA